MAAIHIKKSFKNSGKFLNRAGNDPYFDWTVILGLAFLVAVVFIGFSVELFLQISGDANNSAAAGAGSAAVTGVTLDTSDLVNLVSVFESKKAQAPVFAATYPGPGDPAIPVKAAKVTAQPK